MRRKTRGRRLCAAYEKGCRLCYGGGSVAFSVLGAGLFECCAASRLFRAGTRGQVTRSMHCLWRGYRDYLPADVAASAWWVTFSFFCDVHSMPLYFSGHAFLPQYILTLPPTFLPAVGIALVTPLPSSPAALRAFAGAPPPPERVTSLAGGGRLRAALPARLLPRTATFCRGTLRSRLYALAGGAPAACHAWRGDVDSS